MTPTYHRKRLRKLKKRKRKAQPPFDQLMNQIRGLIRQFLSQLGVKVE